MQHLTRHSKGWLFDGQRLSSSVLQVFVFIPAFGMDLSAVPELDTGALLLGNGELAKDADRRSLSLFPH